MKMIGLKVFGAASLLFVMVTLSSNLRAQCNQDCKEWQTYLYDSTKDGLYCFRYRYADCDWCVWANGNCPLPNTPTYTCTTIKGFPQKYRFPKACNLACPLKGKGYSAAALELNPPETVPDEDWISAGRDAKGCVNKGG